MSNRNRGQFLGMIGVSGGVVAAGCTGSGDQGPLCRRGSSDDDDGGGTGESQTITVDDTMQSAVDSAQSGDTIEIPGGTYEEFVRIEIDLPSERRENGSRAYINDRYVSQASFPRSAVEIYV